MELLLGSKSPRRSQLLMGLGYEFKVVDINCQEVYPKELACEQVASFLSELKSKAYGGDISNEQVLLTCDTVVCHNNNVLGKPRDFQEAREMLATLSLSTHEVISAVTLRTRNDIRTFSDKALVTFCELSSSEIEYYLKKSPPLDKAGSYGIQDWLGMAKIQEIKGSYYTIMGLPTHLLYQELEKLNFHLS